LPGVNIVTLANLGTDFDIGGEIQGAINIVGATRNVAGKVRIATPAEVAAGTAGVVPDAAEMNAAISSAKFVQLGGGLNQDGSKLIQLGKNTGGTAPNSVRATVDGNDYGYLWSSNNAPNNGGANPGYQKLPNGLIMQWGSSVVNINSASLAIIGFPISFTANPISIVVSPGDITSIPVTVAAAYTTTESFDVCTPGQTSGVYRVNWIAFGY